MNVDKKLRHSKKAIVLGIALMNLNFIFLVAAFRPAIQLELCLHMITAVLTLVGIYLGAQSGVDMIQSSKLDKVQDDKTLPR